MPAYDHVFVIVMENHSYSEIIGSSSAPYINSLLPSAGLATEYFGVTHPSLPNYLALTGGSTFGITSDCTTCWVSAGNIGDAMEAAGSSWKAYEESMPSACFVGDSYPYAQKHDPFIYFNDIRTNTSRCQSHVVPYTQLATDLQSTTTTPNFALITPNICDDMHDCSIGTGDSWLQGQVPLILNSPAFKTQRSLLALTWDEDDSTQGNRVPLILIGGGVAAGTRSSATYNHYSLLHTIELARGAATLTTNDAGALPISDLFAASPSGDPVSIAASMLPQDRLHFGLANQPSDLAWMTSSGVPWRYRYQYLAGGVNTGTGWETWNSPSGAFATLYMNASSSSGYIPVFSYYELLQSSPSTGTTESDRDFSNLNNASTMAAYFANFKLLMQLAGTYGKPVVVHVEPDLWGYLQQRAAGGDASTLSAAVASSGFAEAAGLPNTAQGFAWELLKLRDTYARNAVLAIHASEWASGIDIATNTSSTVNAVAIADSTASFLESAGLASNPFASTWDLVFNDVDDHDAGWWEQQGADNSGFTHWWDPTNTTFPNFNRYLAWVGELHARTARPQVVWQVPVGNQYFLTMNNTCGHYQDNVAAYFISHASALYSAGLIAVLFGAGNSCQTDNTDARADGVTNNGGATTTDALGYCNACNNHVSTWPDDDGGYLRIQVGAYYGSAVWQSLGGTWASRPAPASWASNRVDLFTRGADNTLYQATWNGTSWSGWTSLGGGLSSGPAAVAWGPNRIDVFVRGTDNQLWHKFYAGAWSGWEPLGGVLSSGPAVASWGAGRLDVFVRGTDNQLWHKFYAGAWSGWEPLGGVLSADPGAVSWGGNRIDVFVRGSDNGLWHKWWDGSGWRGWEARGGVLSSGPAASSCGAGQLDVFATGAGSALYRTGYDGGWFGWQNVGGQWTSDPGAVCPAGSPLIELFERGTDNAIWASSTLRS